ncbi:transposase [Lacticaseibacillus huelsenbergensis]|uniref:Transposase n=2 Tax=Lacticaseibacillus TaxID=2759736 RepID=A0ABY8DVE3_9LACO|nr:MULTISPECIES: transposase [Lacticaseibacillus]MDG3060763.1 transposase [Lacticaseibacillus sp. BCRC 81376]WFB38978.1 transposase [Lacticaseibacillus huelsenbergensis]WFB43371.1 transposase [Lacticaseibacillus huelsenbergensis]
MIKTHKIKLYPNATMRRELERLFNYRRFCWNQALETWNVMYDASLLMADKTLRPNERKVRDELVWNKADWQYEQSARVLQLAVNDLSKAWKNYFNPKMPDHGKPNWKSKKRSRKTFKTDRAQLLNGKLRLDKPRGAGAWYDIKLAEQPHWQGELKQVCVVQAADGYYASFSIEVQTSVEKRPVLTVTGVDANIGKFDYRTSTGYAIQPTLPDRLPILYARIAHYQRQLARKRKVNPKRFNSAAYRTTRTKLKRQYQRVERIQTDLLQKFTTMLVTDYDLIGIEDLDNQHMRMNKRLAKNLHRSLFGKFKVIMQYKADWYGNTLVLADQFYPSTQRCSRCGHVKTADERVTLSGNLKHRTGHDDYHCYQCGVKLRRDENAVENLIAYAKSKVYGVGYTLKVQEAVTVGLIYFSAGIPLLTGLNEM